MQKQTAKELQTRQQLAPGKRGLYNEQTGSLCTQKIHTQIPFLPPSRLRPSSQRNDRRLSTHTAQHLASAVVAKTQPARIVSVSPIAPEHPPPPPPPPPLSLGFIR
jgi:hypothetical protein